MAICDGGEEGEEQSDDTEDDLQQNPNSQKAYADEGSRLTCVLHRITGNSSTTIYLKQEELSRGKWLILM